MEITKECIVCKKPHTIVVDKDDYTAWLEGKYIQEAMPYVSVDDREMLMSGICPTCWNKIFA